MLKCSKCGTPYNVNDAVCTKCGHVLFDPGRSTVALRIDPNLLRLRRPQVQTGVLSPEKQVTLVIRGISEKFIFQDKTEIILGRTDPLTVSPTHFDLTTYGGHDRGVSRMHALLRFEDTSITITDLNSANGTFINGTRLVANTPHVLKDNDEIRLGNLPMSIRFE
jgi:DNA-directed RNA polymerase subunit RPC12/RpoP